MSSDSIGPKRERLHAAAARRPRRTGGGGDLFVWTIIILLLVGLAIGAWIGSFYIFGHPENALSYSVLSKLKKLDAPERFELTDAPRGEFLNPDGILERYGDLSPREMQRVNDELQRNFIRNFKLASGLVPYVVGDFTILDSYELTTSNYFESGVVVLAQAKENPMVLLEHVFTADAKAVPLLHRMLLTGLDLELKRRMDLSAIVNLRRLQDGRLQVTAIPLIYGSYATTSGPGTLSLDPPKSLNVSAGLPVLDTALVKEASDKFSSYRRRAGLPGVESQASAAKPHLVRVERPLAVGDDPQPPVPEISPEPTPSAPPVPTLEEPPPLLLAEVAPTPESTPPGQLFLESAPTPTPAPIASTAGGAWPVYEPGKMPRGRLLNIQDMGELSERGLGGERIYLRGNFVVTASGPNRAVLRSQSSLPETLGLRGRTSSVRIIAEFPSGSKPPSEGSSFARDSMRPFQITEVRTGADGQVNVFVREVTR